MEFTKILKRFRKNAASPSQTHDTPTIVRAQKEKKKEKPPRDAISPPETPDVSPSQTPDDLLVTKLHSLMPERKPKKADNLKLYRIHKRDKELLNGYGSQTVFWKKTRKVTRELQISKDQTIDDIVSFLGNKRALVEDAKSKNIVKDFFGEQRKEPKTLSTVVSGKGYCIRMVQSLKRLEDAELFDPQKTNQVQSICMKYNNNIPLTRINIERMIFTERASDYQNLLKDRKYIGGEDFFYVEYKLNETINEAFSGIFFQQKNESIFSYTCQIIHTPLENFKRALSEANNELEKYHDSQNMDDKFDSACRIIYLFAHSCPYIRGSAWATEVLATRLMQDIDKKNKSVDFYRSDIDFVAFSSSYDKFKKAIENYVQKNIS